MAVVFAVVTRRNKPATQNALSRNVSAALGTRPRDEVAREARIANTTLASILAGLPGDWRQNPRKVRAMLQSIARLAVTLGADAAEWIECASTGASDNDIKDALRLAGARPRDAISRIRAAGGGVKVLLLPFGVFSETRSGQPSFLERFAEQLVRAVDPHWRLRVTRPSTVQEGIELWKSGEFLMLLGVLNVPGRQALGLQCIDVPGWKVSLSARVAGHGRNSKASWFDLVKGRLGSGESEARVTVVCPKDHAVNRFLRGPCGYPLEAIRETSFESKAIIKDAQALSAQQSNVVVAMDEVQMAELIREGLNDEAKWVGFDDTDAPRYSLALGLHEGDKYFHDLLVRVRDEELKGPSAVALCSILADHVVGLFARRHQLGVPDDMHVGYYHVNRVSLGNRVSEMLARRLEELLPSGDYTRYMKRCVPAGEVDAQPQ